MSVLYKMILIMFLICSLVFKPLYLFCFSVLFINEYFFLIYYSFNLYFNRNSYYHIKIKTQQTSSLSWLSIWVNICSVVAFVKLYNMLLKKRFNLKNIMFLIIIVVLDIPLTFIKTFYIFIFSNLSFRETLEMMNFNVVYENRFKKIEIYEKKIYLNGSYLNELLLRMKSSNSCSEKIKNAFVELRKLSIISYNIEFNEKTMKKVLIARGYDVHKRLIINPHYIMNNGHSTIHFTSKIPKNVGKEKIIVKNNEVVQWADHPIYEAVKKDAINPGSIISMGIHKIEKGPNHIWISSYSEDLIKSSNLIAGFDPGIDKIKYFEEKRARISSLLEEAMSGTGFKNLDPNLIEDIIHNRYTFDLISMESIELLHWLDDVLE